MKTPWSAPCRPNTPEHRRAVLKGLRILARVAIRSYMEERAEASPRAEAGEDGGEGERQTPQWDPED